MICPHCKNVNCPKEVLMTWSVKNGNVKRKRRCKQCKNTFHTVEMVVVMGDRIVYDVRKGR